MVYPFLLSCQLNSSSSFDVKCFGTYIYGIVAERLISNFRSDLIGSGVKHLAAGTYKCKIMTILLSIRSKGNNGKFSTFRTLSAA